MIEIAINFLDSFFRIATICHTGRNYIKIKQTTEFFGEQLYKYACGINFSPCPDSERNELFRALGHVFNIETSLPESPVWQLKSKMPLPQIPQSPMSPDLYPPRKMDLVGTVAWTIGKLYEPCYDHGILGASPAIQHLRQRIKRFALQSWPVLIHGESGTGKELVAQALHAQSDRQDGTWLAINCAALPESLAEATLFGTTRGAFTGAVRDTPGCFQTCDLGTLFLDEVGELSLELQAKLLRVLESGEFMRVGDHRTVKTGARIIAATNRDLEFEVSQGRFREDLLHRLSVLRINTPSLHECGYDKWLLLDHFLSRFARRGQRPVVSSCALELIAKHPFPGNVRELRNFCIRLSTYDSESEIRATDVANELQSTQSRVSTPLDMPGFQLDSWLNSQQLALIQQALLRCDHNFASAARLLGINRTTLYSRLSQLAANAPTFKSEHSEGAKFF